MCSLSYLKTKHGFVITNNRDEFVERAIAFSPTFMKTKTSQILCPIDTQANGTWIGAKENGMVICLLNGAFEPHIRKPPYKKSRGIVALDTIKAEHSFNFIQEMMLENIEPFTMVFFTNQSIQELRWDGTKKHFAKLDHLKNHFWSSCTLYNKAEIKKRSDYFQNWTAQNYLDSNSILLFHQNKIEEEDKPGIFLERAFQKTVSITQIIKKKNTVSFEYFDMVKNNFYKNNFTIYEKTI